MKPLPYNMKPGYLAAYKHLLNRIREILSEQRPEKDNLEACFRTALYCWEELKSRIRECEFDSDEEEIRFFKSIKPRFTGLVEYYAQRYQAALFAPHSSPAASLYFWKMELKRIDRFFAFNQDFVRYMESGDTDLDEIYFLRIYSDLSNVEKARVYDLDPDVASSHDWIVSKMIALGKYRFDVEAEIVKLEPLKKNK
ncbi:MAG: RteC domain-containing protein [Bacteroidota bacterium]|nr:RteC domain-containing protein [Bacteroidota bacterium]